MEYFIYRYLSHTHKHLDHSLWPRRNIKQTRALFFCFVVIAVHVHSGFFSASLNDSTVFLPSICWNICNACQFVHSFVYVWSLMMMCHTHIQWREEVLYLGTCSRTEQKSQNLPPFFPMDNDVKNTLNGLFIIQILFYLFIFERFQNFFFHRDKTNVSKINNYSNEIIKIESEIMILWNICKKEL